MIKTVSKSFLTALVELVPVAICSLIFAAILSTLTGLYFDFAFFPESLFYSLSIILYFCIYLLLKNHSIIRSKIDSFMHASLSGLFMGFYSYQIFADTAWIAELLSGYWVYKLILYITISVWQGVFLSYSLVWISKRKARNKVEEIDGEAQKL